MTLSYLKGRYATGAEISVAEYQGETEIYGAKISHPFIKSRNTTLNMALGWDHKYAEYEDSSRNGIYAIDDLDEFYARLDFDNLDRFLGKNLVSLGVYYGELTNRYDKPSFRQITDVPQSLDVSKASERYERYTFSLARIQKVYGYTNFMLRGTGQLAPGHYLNPLSWYSVGGYGTVRGWKPENQIRGDSGYTVTGELMFAPPYVSDNVYFGQRVAQMVQFALFYDHGGVFIDEPLESILGGGQTAAIENTSEYLSGYGVGVRLFYKDRFRFKLDVGFPIGDRTDDADSCVVYVLGSYNFF